MPVKIGLDCGHGLKTVGKQTPDGIKEWILNDKVRDKVVSFLADYDCEFIHTDGNEGNTDESLTSRLNMYLNSGAESFASLHHNALKSTWSGATGVEVYVDINATTEDLRLADCIYGRLVNYTKLKGRGIKRADFTVINQNKIPAVLVEGGFMDGTNDYKYITSDEGQTAYAKAVAEGLIEFHNLKKKVVVAKNDTTKTEELYRVRKTWKDAASQIGAYKSLANAKKACKKGYSVYDGKGNVVYTCSDVVYYAKYNGTSGSIVTALKSLGIASSFSHRKKIAKANGIIDYSGTAKQNTTMLNLLKNGKLIKV